MAFFPSQYKDKHDKISVHVYLEILMSLIFRELLLSIAQYLAQEGLVTVRAGRGEEKGGKQRTVFRRVWDISESMTSSGQVLLSWS